MISFSEFRDLVAAADGALVPVWDDVLLDQETAVATYAKLRRAPFSFLLESAPAGGEQWARYTFMGTEPSAAWRVRDGLVEDWLPGRGWHAARAPEDALADLAQALEARRALPVPALGRFWTGAVGYFGYDMVRAIERLPHAPVRATPVPDALFVFPSTLVILDNLRATARIVTAVEACGADSAQELRARYDAALQRTHEMRARLRAPAALPPFDPETPVPPADVRAPYARAAFLRDVERIREYITAGDVFQALLARRVIVPHDFDTFTLYRALRAVNPSPYMFFLEYDDMQLVGSSPELLVRVADDTITLRPIAGTRPRGATADADAALAAELLADEKERAEHVMLVDLGRNDVGRVAAFGTVEVTDFMRVERYSHVMHLVSDIQGRLRPDVNAVDVLRATFPAGTMTGAPKVRAMEIIDELEPERRGPYAGAVGYIATDRRAMDLAIAIRACLVAGGEASVQAGAGIVADSVPEREWEETENKMRSMLTAIGLVRGAVRQG